MKKAQTPPGYYFDETKNRFFKVLPGHCNRDDTAFITPSKAALLESTKTVSHPQDLNSRDIAHSQWHRQVEGISFPNVDFENYSISRLSVSPIKEIHSRFSWSTVETVLLPPNALEPVAIFQNDNSEVTLRFLKLQNGKSNFPHLRLVECHPSARLFGDIIDPCVITNPYRLIFAQMSGLTRVSSSIVLHDIEHGYYENLSFGSREIWSCCWSKKLQRLGIGSRRMAYCLDPETRAVQTLPTNSQDVLAQTFGCAKSTVRSVLFNGCRNGHVIANDLRVASKPIVLVASYKHYPTSIASVLCSPVDDHQIIVADRTGNAFLWDLRNAERPCGRFRHQEKLQSYDKPRYQLSHNGRFFYVTCSDKAVEIWCTITCQLLASITLSDTAIMSKLKTAALLTDPNVYSDVCTSPALFLGTTDGLCLVRSNFLLFMMDQYRNTDPVSLIRTHKLSYINGLIRQSKVEQLRHWLHIHGQNGQGHKDVIQKRLKSLVKREMEKLNSPQKDVVKASPPPVEIRYFLVMDIEATCEEPLPPDYPHEIIELPLIVVDATTKEIVAEFREICRPINNTILSEFCIQLTGITQADVDAADTFADVFPRFLMFAGPYLEQSCALVTDSPYDVYRFLLPACQQHFQQFPDWAKSWVNLRKLFSYFYKTERMNLAGMLSRLGMDFDGRPHCGADDARNIAKILIVLLNDGCAPLPNEGLTKVVAGGLSARRSNSNSPPKNVSNEESPEKISKQHDHKLEADLAALNLKA